MHIAVAKGAKENESFLSYVEFLKDEHFIPRDSEGWVDAIRKSGNDANHEIVIMSVQQGQQLVRFVEMLLKLVYEFPAEIAS